MHDEDGVFLFLRALVMLEILGAAALGETIQLCLHGRQGRRVHRLLSLAQIMIHRVFCRHLRNKIVARSGLAHARFLLNAGDTIRQGELFVLFNFQIVAEMLELLSVLGVDFRKLSAHLVRLGLGQRVELLLVLVLDRFHRLESTYALDLDLLFLCTEIERRPVAACLALPHRQTRVVPPVVLR